METFNHIRLKTLDFSPTKVGDLLYMEGPILSHFVGDDGNQYLFKWIDQDEEKNRWIVFQVENYNLFEFLNKKSNLLSLIYSNDIVYFIDVNGNLEIESTFIVDKNEIPHSYLPSTSSFYNEKHFEDYAVQLKLELEQEFKVNEVIKYSVQKSFESSPTLRPLIANIQIPTLNLFGHIPYIQTIYISILIHAGFKYKATNNKRFEDIGFYLVNGFIQNTNPKKLLLNKFPIHEFQEEYNKFLHLYSSHSHKSHSKHLCLTWILKSINTAELGTSEVLKSIEALEEELSRAID